MGADEIREKQRDLANLAVCFVRRAGIGRHDPPGSLRAAAPLVRELDLAANALTQWTDVFQVGHELERLTRLSLSGNPLDAVEPTPAPPLLGQHLTVLELNQVPHAWASLLVLLEHGSVPVLETVTLCANGLTKVDPLGWTGGELGQRQEYFSQLFSRIRMLDLGENQIEQWIPYVEQFACLPLLETLLINENALESVPHGRQVAEYLEQCEGSALLACFSLFVFFP